MAKNSLVYCLFDFVDNRNLGIGTLESISIPRNFQAKIQKEKLKHLEQMRNDKTEIGISWPSEGGEWSLPKKGCDKEKQTLKAVILSFSADKKTISETRSAILNTRRPPAKPAISNSYKANSRSSVLPSNKSSTRNTNVENTITEQHEPYNNPHTEGLQEILPIYKMTNVAIEKIYEDLGVKPFDQEPFTSGESYIAYSTDDETIEQPISSEVFTPLLPMSNAPFARTGRELKVRKRINIDSTSNTSKNPVSATKKQRLEKYHEMKQRMEQQLRASQALLDEDSQDARQPNVDYLEEIRLLKKEISDAQLNFDHERDLFNEELEKKNKEINDKDALIRELMHSNPDVLVRDLKEGLLRLQCMISKATPSPSPTHEAPNILAIQSPRSLLKKLDEDCKTIIATSVLRTAISYAKCGKSYLNKTVSCICKGLWDREFMATHSVSGRESNGKAKPKLPVDVVQAITNFIISFWKSQHHVDISPKEVRSSISAKLLREHSTKKAIDLVMMTKVVDADADNQLEAIDDR